MSLIKTYSHAAPYIREQALIAAELKRSARTQRDQKHYVGQMCGLIAALDILLRAPEGADTPPGYPDFRGDPRAVPELERFLGGPRRMRELGFTT